MAKAQAMYTCTACGAVHSKWSGQCADCGAWNTITEELPSSRFTKTGSKKSGHVIPFASLGDAVEVTPRQATGIEELDRVLGGGLVAGSAILIGGDPGIGKSTLLLQAVVALAQSGATCFYITGEESVDQVRLRAKRLGLDAAGVQIAAATSVSDLLATFAKEKKPDVIVIDSIQTMFIDTVESAPGTVTQVRGASHELITMAKETGAALFLVGHVTKEGQIAGPKVLEHMVDTVLYFEGERGQAFRILRAVKNRYGPANEIGVFEMQDKGLVEVENPSALFVSGKAGEVSGSVIYAGMEGTRPVLVEIQALVSPTHMATPRRAVVGWDINRLAMLLAVLTTRCGKKLGDKEVYLNVVGGMRIQEPAADLAVAAAIVSSLANIPFPQKMVVLGEIGLSGEVRPVSHIATRLKEAQKLGFTQALVPAGVQESRKGFILQEIKYINQIDQILANSA